MFFIHLFINGHLNAFRIFTTVNNAVMNIEVSVSFNVLLSFSSDILLRSGIAVSYGSFIFNFFQELPYYFMWWPRQFRCPPKSWQGFPFQKYLSFDDNNLTVMKWCLIVILICIYLINNNTVHLFIYLLAIEVSSLGKCLFCPFFNLDFFFNLSCMSSLYFVY